MKAKIEQTFDLKLSDGGIVQWDGCTGKNAAKRYMDSHRDRVVIAWRYPKTELHIGMIRTVEPC